MTRLTRKLLQLTLAAGTGVGCLFVSENASLTGSASLVSTAEAVIGRPLTPMSYAGVARRTTRRAVAVGAAGAVAYGAYAAPVYAAPVVVAPAGGCVQAVDAYGRLYTRCY